MSKLSKPIPAKTALLAVGARIDSSSFFNGLAMVGIMRRKTYLSTTGSGEEKYYWVISDNWLHCGENKRTMHEFKTDPVFVPETIPQLLVQSCEAHLAHARSLAVHQKDATLTGSERLSNEDA